MRTALETPRLRLEPWDDAHFERFAALHARPRRDPLHPPEPLDRASALEHHERSLAEWDLHGFGKRAIIEPETDHWLGFVELSLVGPTRDRATTTSSSGTSSSRPAGARGSRRKPRSRARDEAFERCGLNELVGRCRVENSPRRACSPRSASGACASSSSTTASSSRSITSSVSKLGRRPGRRRAASTSSVTPRPAPERSTVRRAEPPSWPTGNQAVTDAASTTSSCSPAARDG